MKPNLSFGLPKSLLEASSDLGATSSQTFWKVTFPLSLPGVAAGSILVFVPCLGSFATPELLGGAQCAMLGSQINLYFTQVRNPAAGAALTLVLMLFTGALLGLYYRLRRTEGLA